MDTRTYKNSNQANIRDDNLIAILHKTRQLQSLNLSETYYLTVEVLKKIAELGLPLKRWVTRPLVKVRDWHSIADCSWTALLTWWAKTLPRRMWTLHICAHWPRWQNCSSNGTSSATRACEPSRIWSTWRVSILQAARWRVRDSTTCRACTNWNTFISRSHPPSLMMHSATLHNWHLSECWRCNIANTSLTRVLPSCQHSPTWHASTSTAAGKSRVTRLARRPKLTPCSGITDATIEVVVRSMPNLVQLHLSDCSKLTDRAVDMIRGYVQWSIVRWLSLTLG